MSRFANISVLSSGQIGKKYTDNHDELIDAYIAHWDNEIAKVLPDEPDLIVLPECCDTFFGHTADQLFEYLKSKGRMLEHLKEAAKAHNTYIAYSAERYFPDDEKFPNRNSTVIIARDGSIAGIYDKNHVTINANTKNKSGYGSEAKVIETDFARIACCICFDLNFDELREKYIPRKPELVVFSSMYHGGLAQTHWAYTLDSYFASSVVGDQSRIIDPFGQEVATTTKDCNYATGRVNFDCVTVHLDENEKRIFAAKQKYGRAFKINDPSNHRTVILSCERDDMTIGDIVNEFEIETFESYIGRSRAHREFTIHNS